jgi:hypothetical protein
MRKSCEQCGYEAAITVCWLLSTVGCSPRVQKCSKASAFCFDCLSRLLLPNNMPMAVCLRERLREAYTASTCGQAAACRAIEGGENRFSTEVSA